MTLTTKPDFADIEVRIFPCQERGYPVEITLDGQQEFRAGYLAESILPWVSSGEAGRDGRRLFEAFLSDPALRSAWGEARGRAPRRRIRLRIDPAAAELHEIPWELLNEDNVMLSAGEQTPFSRYLPVALPWGNTAEERPIRILVAISNPDDLQAQYNLQQLDVARERKTLESALVEAGATVEMHFLEAPVTLERLEEELRQGYHILHYLGHGVFSARRGQAALYLQNSDGHTQVVNDEAVIGMLSRQQKHPSLVFLAACQSAARSTADAFLGFAPKLVAAGVPAVVVMQDFVDVETARKLGAVFYQRLAEHGTVDRALNEARSVLLTASRPDAAVPVLFMQLKSGQLWSAASIRNQSAGKALQDEGNRANSPTVKKPVLAVPPSPPKNFIGRERQIAGITAALSNDESAVIAILGMGGVGKTALVKQVAARIGPKFPGGFFWGDELPPKDSNPNNILKQWGRLCGQNLEKESEESLPTAIRGLLITYRAEFGPFLVVLDDVRLDWTGDGVDTVRQALPPDIPLLITTRQAQIAQELDAKVFNLDVLSRAESQQLLMTLSERKITPTQAHTFADLCGDMPLALELMAKLTKRRKSEWLLERLQDETNRLEMLKLDDARKKEQSVRLSFDLNYQSLAEQYPESARIFRILAAFARPAFIILEHLASALAKANQQKLLAAQPGSSAGRTQNQQQVTKSDENSVFVSYAWGGESEHIVDELERAFAESGISIVRDKKDLGYKGSIETFEQRIGQGKCIVLVISDKYLRSEHCMYELVEVERNRELRERIFPIVLADARIYKAVDRLIYISHWDEQIQQLNQAIKQIGVMTYLTNIAADLDKYARIRTNIDHLTDLLSDMNTLTPEMHAVNGFSVLINAVKAALGGTQNVSQPGQPMLQSGKIPSGKVEQFRKLPTENSEKAYRRVAEDEFLRLADWSLLAEESIDGSEMQDFHLHNLLHEYAQSLLVDESEFETAVNTQIQYCVAFAEANTEIDLQVNRKSTQEYEKSVVQLFQALKQIKECYLVEGTGWEQNPELARQVIALVESLDHHWQWHSRFADQVEWLPVAYRCAGTRNDPLKQADFARRLGRVLSWQGQLEEASEWMERCQTALGENTGETANAIRALMFVHSAAIHYQKNAYESAEVSCQRGLALVGEQKHPKIFAEGCNLLGAIKLKTGDLEAALKAFEQSLAVWKQVGDQYQINRVGDNLRATLYYLGDLAQSRKIEEATLQYWEQFPNRIELSTALTNHGLTLAMDGEHQAAIELHQRAMQISDLLNVPRARSLARVNIAWPYLALEKYDQAEAYFNQTLEIQSKFNLTENRIEAYRGLAAVALGRGLGQRALELANQALGFAKAENEPLEEGAALRILGQAYHLTGQFTQARAALENSLALLRENGYRYESLLTLQALTKLYADLGDEKARATADEARALAREMGLSLPD